MKNNNENSKRASFLGFIKYLILSIVLAGIIFGALYLYTFYNNKANAHADSLNAEENFYNYSFTYYQEYYVENTKEYHGEEVITLCQNDIIDKQNNGYATADYIQDSDTQGAWTEDYNCFSTKYFVEEKTVNMKVLKGETPELSSYRKDFDVFYSNFLYWQASNGKVYSEFELPEATQDLKFTAKYKIADKLHFTVNNDAGFESTLNLNTANIDFRETIVKIGSETKTVYYYGYDFRNAPVTSIYQYWIFKGAYLDDNGVYKIGVCNIRNDKELLTVEYTGFNNQNEFNKYRSSCTGKAYYSTLGNALCDVTYSIFGTTGVVSNIASTISSGAKLAEDGTGIISNGIFIFSDMISNVKVGLTYFLAIGLAVLVTFLVLKLIFWIIKLIGGAISGKKKKYQ